MAVGGVACNEVGVKRFGLGVGDSGLFPLEFGVPDASPLHLRGKPLLRSMAPAERKLEALGRAREM